MLVLKSHCSEAAAVSDQAAEMLILHSLQTAWQKLPVSTFVGIMPGCGMVEDRGAGDAPVPVNKR